MYDATLVAAPKTAGEPPGNTSGAPRSDGMTETARPTIAIVGSGPSGCYAGQFLAKRWPGAEITIFESLPVPYGLIRYGVAADHQGAKGVVRQFDRMFTTGGVRFVGNVSVGRDIDFDQLAAGFDIVVLATGLPEDRSLDIPQEPGSRVIGAGALLRTLNGFPARCLPCDETGTHAPLGQRVGVVGMGNVAVDVVRLLSKGADGFIGSDINDDILGQLRPTAPLTIDVVGRSAAAEAKCDAAMLREVVLLDNVDIEVTGLKDSDQGPIAELMRPYASRADLAADVNTVSAPQRTRVRLHFGVTPEVIECGDGHTLLRARRGHGERMEFAVDSLITAVGFTCGRTDDRSCPSPAWSGPHVYRVGWLRRGPKGTIPENRKDAQQVVDAIVSDVASGRIALGRPGFDAVAQRIDGQAVNFAGWQRIEMHERQSAHPDRCRRKIVDIDTMLTIATSVEKSITTT
ncbi:NAD(P)-binding protein [Mycolicibacterium goodii]|uniref:NAD(P)-binding protein n=1 Tax=Mycolicibacterium goodii TaxID=134601 RepID=UPI000C261672|nr:NAD(P)-binding protein [Mycolicibacterium goodii]PJK19518.1 oxidoreductase [Mycolicibacterium goodii]